MNRSIQLQHLRLAALAGEEMPHPRVNYLCLEDLSIRERLELAVDRYRYPLGYGPLDTHYAPFFYGEEERRRRVCAAYGICLEALETALGERGQPAI